MHGPVSARYSAPVHVREVEVSVNASKTGVWEGCRCEGVCGLSPRKRGEYWLLLPPGVKVIKQ